MLRLFLLGTVVAGLLGLAPVAQARPAAALTLQVAFFPDGTINVTLPDGTTVGTPSGTPTTIPAGAYSIVMSGPGGCTPLPLFTLRGPNTDIVTDMSGGEVDALDYNAYFAPNATFTWRTDRGPAAVTHTFVTSGTVVGTATGTGTSTTGPVTAPPTSQDIVGSDVIPFRGTLTGTVTPAGALKLLLKGKQVSRLTAGKYTIAITDESPKSGFVFLKAAGKPTNVTAAAFVGRRSLSVNLTAGKWLFELAPHGKATAVVVS